MTFASSRKSLSFPRPEFYRQLLTPESPALMAYDAAVSLARAVRAAGGRALLVGGAVRDYFFGLSALDFDLEIYGLRPEQAESLVGAVGRISVVGRSFGILKIDFGDGAGVDVSIPRSDSKIDSGHKGFAINTDPNMSIEEASRRRDFTINCLAADILSGEVFNNFNGLKDIFDRRLRVTDPERFRDDPLRILRALQFIARFNLDIDEDSASLLREMVPSLVELPKERLGAEWKKLLVKGVKPSWGLRWGRELGVFKILHPEIEILKHTEQDKRWHPEGDVFTHTLLVVDEASRLANEHHLPFKSYLVLMLSALLHDIGKPEVTVSEDDNITSYGHERTAEKPAKNFLEKIGIDHQTRDKVINLIKNHMAPIQLYLEDQRGNLVTDSAIRRLARRIYPAKLSELCLLVAADYRGRGPLKSSKDEFDILQASSWLLKRADDLHFYENPGRL